MYINHIIQYTNVFLLGSLLDAEDIDSARPDEKSILTYVASYYHTFARMKNEQKSGKRIANVSTHLEFQNGMTFIRWSGAVSAWLTWVAEAGDGAGAVA